MKIADQNDIQVAADFAHHHGQIVYAASSAERVLIYTPTFIVAGLVARVGYTAIEVIQASIVFETGKFENAIKGDFKDHQSWPTPIRVPHSAICLCTHVPVDEDTKAEDIRSVEAWIEKQENRVFDIAFEGERMLVYTPTFIVTGNCSRVGPMVIELSDASIVFETGKYEEASKGNFQDAQSWGGNIRVPKGAICLTKLVLKERLLFINDFC